jgi:hypothetical protein
LAVVVCAVAFALALAAFIAPRDSQAASEARCGTLGINCICSEPMQTSNWAVASSNMQNPADTTASDKQCSLGGTGEFIEWLDCCIQTMQGVTPAQEPAAFAALPGGQSLTHLARLPMSGAGGSQGGGSFGHNRLGATFVKRVAMRWYQYYSPNYQFSSDAGCQNNKFLVMTGGDVVSEGDLGGNFHQYFLPNSECCIAGPGPDEMAIGPHDLRGKWWRAEFVVVNRAGGPAPNGIRYYLFLKNITDNGPELRVVDSTYAGSVSGWVPSNALSPPARIDAIGSDLHRFPDGTCAGYRTFTHFMTAGWDTDSGQRIGAAGEVEGTVPVPPAPSNLIVQ